MASSIATTLTRMAENLRKMDRLRDVTIGEPKAAPGGEFSAAVFLMGMRPYPEASGLGSLSGVYTVMVRLYRNMLADPTEQALLQLTDKIVDDFAGEYDLGGTVRQVDLLGESGEGLRVQFGYVTVGSTLYRVADVTVPLIVDGLKTYAA